MQMSIICLGKLYIYIYIYLLHILYIHLFYIYLEKKTCFKKTNKTLKGYNHTYTSKNEHHYKISCSSTK